MTETARISNSIWNFRIRSTLRSGVSTKSFLLFIVYFREIAAFQELTRMPSIHKTTKKQINYKQVPTKTLVSFFTSLLLLQVIRCVKISHRQPHRLFGLFCLWPSYNLLQKCWTPIEKIDFLCPLPPFQC